MQLNGEKTIEYATYYPCDEYDKDRVDLPFVDGKERCGAEDDADDELRGTFRGVAEILLVHQHESSRSDEAYDEGAQDAEDGANGRVVSIFYQETAD